MKVKEQVFLRFSYLKKILPYIDTRKACVLGILNLVMIITAIIPPYIYQYYIDNVIIANKEERFIFVCIWYIVVWVLETVLLAIQMLLSNTLFNKFITDIKIKLCQKSIEAPLSFFELYTSADLKVRVNEDVEKVEKFLKEDIFEFVSNFVTTCVLVIILIYTNWRLALVGLITVPLSFWLSSYFASYIRRTQEVYREQYGEYEGWLKESVSFWKEAKLFNTEEAELDEFEKKWNNLHIFYFKKQVVSIIYGCLIMLKDFFFTRLVFYFIGAIILFRGEITTGFFLMFLLFYSSLVDNLGKLGQSKMNLATNISSLTRVSEILDYKIKRKENKCINKISDGSIVFDNVSFSYSADEDYILKNINLQIKNNEKVTIVGKSGCGKTTLISLLLKFYDTYNGSILVSEQNILDIEDSCWFSYIGAVMQNSFLFNMSIRDNLLMANPNSSEQEMKQALAEVNMMGYIDSLSEGLDTLIDEDSTNLSGGQRQRISIAKVLLRNPRIIILDEATSALDSLTEKIVNEIVEKLHKEGKTIIIIAHRTSAVLQADRIIVLSDGEIAGDGTHEELMNYNSVYGRIFNSMKKEEGK